MSELPTGTVIYRCRGSARAGELGGKHPCARSEDSPAVAAAGFGPIGALADPSAVRGVLDEPAKRLDGTPAAQD